MKPNDSQRTYSVMLASEHKQGLHEDAPHKMCRECHPAEAALLDQLADPEDPFDDEDI